MNVRTFNNIHIPIQNVTKYLETHLNKRITWAQQLKIKEKNPTLAYTFSVYYCPLL